MPPILPLLVTAAAQAAPAPPVVIPDRPALTEQIAAADAKLFDLMFVKACDPPRIRALIADDIEFYHDKAGVTARSADEFMAGYLKSCKGREVPTGWRSRRELVASSLTVDPVPGHGAMEAGEHLFYERKGDSPEQLAGRARFAMVWKRDGSAWKLSRVLSFAHAPASASR